METTICGRTVDVIQEPRYYKMVEVLIKGLESLDGNLYFFRHRSIWTGETQCTLGCLAFRHFTTLVTSVGPSLESTCRELLETFVSNPDNPLHVSSLSGLIMKLQLMGVLDV